MTDDPRAPRNAEAFAAWLDARLAGADTLTDQLMRGLAEVHESDEQTEWRQQQEWRRTRGMTT